MESGLPSGESRWHRPNLYLTIVAIYLIIISVISLLVVLYISPLGGVFGLLVYGALFFLLCILAITSVFGAKMLLRREEISLSIACLIVWSIFLLLGTVLNWSPMVTINGNTETFPPKNLVAFFFVVTVVMLLLLLKTQKHIRSTSKSDSFQNNS